MNKRQKKELKLELLREKKRRNFFSFLKNTIPRYQDSDFYHHFTDKLQDFDKKIHNIEFPHLIINCAPRVGKSAMILRYCLWEMLNNSDFKVIYGTYSDRLSKIMSREMKMILESDYVKKYWPHVKLKEGFSALDSWAISNGSSIFFTSVGGSISGIGGNLIALDDIFSSMESARSDAYRQQLFSWVSSALMTRVMPEKHAIIFLFTRWVQDDLAGFVESEERKNPQFPKFDRIQFPIIGRDGVSLIPERFPLPLLEQLKAKSGTKVWDALYMCNPTSDTDRILRTEWIDQVDKLPICNWNNQQVIVAIDMAFKGKTTSDYNVCVCLARGLDNRIYLLDYLRIQADFTDFLVKFSKWYSGLPKINALVIEDKANGSALQSVLKSKFNNIKMVNPDKDKVSRVSAIAPMVESGSLVFLRKNTVDYLEIIEEIDKFPSPSVHDDFIDALTHGLQYISDKSGGIVSGFNWSSVLGNF